MAIEPVDQSQVERCIGRCIGCFGSTQQEQHQAAAALIILA
jgi:hypothetical protein